MTRLVSWQDFGTHDESAYPELWRGCVGAWAPCLGPTGLRLHDLSRYRNWGTLTNMDAATDWVVNAGQYALDLDGTNDFVQTAVNLPSTGDFTFSAWFRSTQASEGNIFSNNAGQSGRCDIKAISLNGSVYNAFVFINGTPNLSLFGTSQTNDAVWHSLAVSRLGTLFSLYVDGRLESTATSSNAIDTATPFRIGASANTTQLLSGFFDSVMLNNRALSPAEIRILATHRGIAFERHKRRSVFFDAAFFNPAWARNSNVIISPVGAA